MATRPKRGERGGARRTETAEESRTALDLLAPATDPGRFDRHTDTAHQFAVIASSNRLHINPRVLADQLGDAAGEIPKPAADRLERGSQTGADVAKRLGLGEGGSQSLVALFTYHVFNVLREEKNGMPVSPTRIEEITNATLDDVRAACGEPAAAEATRALAAL